MKITIKMLAPWSVAVYVDGEIDDCFDCANKAVDYVQSLGQGFANVTLCESEGYAPACAKAKQREKFFNEGDL